MAGERIELLAGVCPVLYKPNQPYSVLMTQELTTKELTGKVAGMWGPPFETVEVGENHRQALERCFEEEIRITRGKAFIPVDLEEAKLCIVRVSPPESAAWVHAYSVPVSADFEAVRGDFMDEVGHPEWVNCSRVLDAEKGNNRIIFRPATYEIIRAHLARLSKPIGFIPREVETPINLPDWELFHLIDQGVSQIEALFQLGIDPQPLLNSRFLIR